MGCGSGSGAPRAAAAEASGRKVMCVRLKKELPGLAESPFDGHPLGQRIFENVSQEAWGQWLEHQKMILNEYRLNLGKREHQEMLLAEMEKYFFAEGTNLPPGYVPEAQTK